MNASGATVISRLAELAGASNVLTDPGQIAAYQIDGTIPTVVVRPGSTQEVVEIVKFAAGEKLAIVPTGSRTKLSMGMPSRKYDLALDMTRMDRVVAYDPGDLTLSVEPGIQLPKLADTLAEHRQFVPLEVPFMDRATVGGTIASGVDSPLRQLYGTARDFVLGMEFVTGDGVAAKSGGRVVKNVTGYDIHKLMIGALGTLGVVTKINFRTFPITRMTRTYAAAFRGPAAACGFRDAIARSAFRPRSVEILAADGGNSLQLGQRAGLSFEDDRWTVVTCFAGDESILARIHREMEPLAHAAGRGALESLAELRDDQRNKVTRYITDFPAAIAEHSPAAAIFKISALPTDLAVLADTIRSCEAPWAAMARGLGVTYLALLPLGRNEEALRILKQECTRIFNLPWKAQRGRSVLLWCPTELKSEINVWGSPSTDFPLMQQLKSVFDPSGILSPGRFLGGL
jgi:glycolate dehydrogenase FAD-binding subunit